MIKGRDGKSQILDKAQKVTIYYPKWEVILDSSLILDD